MRVYARGALVRKTVYYPRVIYIQLIYLLTCIRFVSLIILFDIR